MAKRVRELTYERLSRPRKPKGPTAKARAKRKRAEAPVAKSVRAQCVERDGHCRLAGTTVCSGPSEWAHLEDKKRARTRGMAPTIRHTTQKSMMLCQGHHARYDAGEILLYLGPDGADGKVSAMEF